MSCISFIIFTCVFDIENDLSSIQCFISCSMRMICHCYGAFVCRLFVLAESWTYACLSNVLGVR